MKSILQRLSVILVFSLLCFLTVAAQEITVDSLKYELNSTDHTATVSGYVEGIKHANIPNTVDYNGQEFIVTALGNSCFRLCSGLTSINISDGVTAIGKSCFYGCSGLTSIKIPDGVTALGDWCFSYCSGLTSIKIPDGVTAIGYYCFGGCSGLTSINIPDGVTALGDLCFHGVGTSSAPCKLYIDDQFDSQLLTKSGSYYTMGAGYFVVPVQSIRLSTSHLYLTKSQEFQQVTATAVPAAANNTGIKLTSGNTSVVSIERGSLVIKGSGETEIRYEAADGYGAYAVCHVKVVDPPESIKIDLRQKDCSLTLLVDYFESYF